ncbi:MAG TPA: hypothetical protein VIV59_13095, partial [Anaeromyxobacteraceae bacterium]
MLMVREGSRKQDAAAAERALPGPSSCPNMVPTPAGAMREREARQAEESRGHERADKRDEHMKYEEASESVLAARAGDRQGPLRDP